jgi:beta-1,4-mannosyl-glycoprotein beta-1,4-N-acetylglucosaminyltransferase
MFFNELDLLELRLNILDPYVDYFVISEATITFSGKAKPLYYLENKIRFKKFEDKIIHNIVNDTPNNFTD